MEREKIIDEMAKIAFPIYGASARELDGLKRLADAGYRKIPEDAVVLTQEMAYEYRADVAKVQFLKDELRKEMAREIFEKIYEKEKYYPLASVGISQSDMIEIAKVFGIKYTSDGVKVDD